MQRGYQCLGTSNRSVRVTVHITVNGKPRKLESRCTLLDLLKEHDVNPVVVAIEHNGEIVKRDTYGEVVLTDGDIIEIVHMVGGGA